MASHTVSVGLIQETASPDLDANLTRTIERIREAAAQGAQIVSLQELFNAPYFCKSLRIEKFDIAEPVDGPTITTLRKLAQELSSRARSCRSTNARRLGLYRNSASVIDADGTLLGTYRKMHIPARSVVRGEVLLRAG